MKSYINELRRKIAEASVNGMDIESILRELQETQWEEWINEVRQCEHPLNVCCECFHNVPYNIKNLSSSGMICEDCQRENALKYRTTPSPCNVCNKSHLPHEFVKVVIPTGTAPHTQTIRTCPDQTDLALDQYKTNCMSCNKRYLPFNSKRLCDDCWYDPIIVLETDRVYNQNKRALDLGLPATLTVHQWLNTLEYFDRKCAYCSIKFKGLEHYMPLSLGGGTTFDNCLPSCSRCNTVKKDKHPDEFANLFPRENIERIRSWLEQTVNN